MIWLIGKRLLWLVLTLWVVFTISFVLMKSVPGGPLTKERRVPKEIEENLKRRYNLDESNTQQYLRELKNLSRLDLGMSYSLPDFSVAEIIGQGLPVSAALGTLALAFALTLGLSTGVVSAVRRGSVLDVSVRSIATLGIAVPNFVLAGVTIILFVFLLPLFPAAGWGSPRQLVLPALCLGAPYAAYIARLSRTGMLDVLGQDYIRTAYAKGLSTRSVILRHALRGAMMPVVSFLGPAIAGILTGSLVVEQIFAIPGLGMHFVQAASQRDYFLATGLTLLYTAMVYMLNLTVDVLYRYLDPRIELN